MIRKLQRQKVIILDDFGLQSIDSLKSHILLELIKDRYNLGSVIITSQVPVDNWYTLIAEKTIADAIMDQLIHRAHRIELGGESAFFSINEEEETVKLRIDDDFNIINATELLYNRVSLLHFKVSRMRHFAARTIKDVQFIEE